MKEYASDKIRNIAVLSHDGAGKTAVVESLLLASGAVTAVGVGKDNKHIMDFEPEEIKRNVTIQLGIAPCEWDGFKLNFLDTPGYSEFCGEVRAALRACDGILLVVSAEAGIEMDTERAWDYGVELQLPRMIYVNKMDTEHADFFGSLEKMRAVFGKSIMPLQIPIGEGADFRGIIDVCKMIAWEWTSGNIEEIKVPPQYMAKAREVREMCMEAAAEGDDELLEKYLNGDELTLEELRFGLHQGMLTGRVCPVMCGSATRHIGTTELLNRLVRYMPDASQKVMMGTDTKSGDPVMVYPNKPFTGFVFKTLIDPFSGKLSYIRIFSGELKEGDKILNVTQNKEEKLGKIFTLVGKEQVPVEKATAGDIVVLPKLNTAKTGDTFATPEFPVVYEAIRFPNPLHTVALVPAKKGEEEKLTNALLRISEEDPTCRIEKDPEGHQIILHCMGDVHLDHILTKMERKYGIKAVQSEMYIPYRETIRSTVTAEGKHKKQSGGHGQYGHCWLELIPQEAGEGFSFENKVVGGVIPKEFINPIEAGVKQAMEGGVVAGYPMVDIKVIVYDGSFHEVDSSEAAFKVAGSMAFKAGAEKANPVLLEPYVKVEVTVPEEYMGDVIGDLNSRRGRIDGMEPRNGVQVINAFVPLSEMFGYSTDLRSKTQGRGNYSMEVSFYDEVPKNIADAVVAKNKGE